MTVGSVRVGDGDIDIARVERIIFKRLLITGRHVVSLALRQRVERGVQVCRRSRRALLLELEISSCGLKLRLVHVRAALLLSCQVLILLILLILLKPMVVLVEGVVGRGRGGSLQRPVQQTAGGDSTSKSSSSVGVLP